MFYSIQYVGGGYHQTGAHPVRAIQQATKYRTPQQANLVILLNLLDGQVVENHTPFVVQRRQP